MTLVLYTKLLSGAEQCRSYQKMCSGLISPIGHGRQLWHCTGTQSQQFYRSSAQGQDHAVLTITTITPPLQSSCLNVSRVGGPIPGLTSWCPILSYIYNETHKYPILWWRRKQQLCAGCLPIQLIYSSPLTQHQ